MSDYSQHTVSLRHLLSELEEALRNKQWRTADRVAADAMGRLHRIHGCIHRAERDDAARQS